LEKQQLLESDRDELTKMNDELNAEMRHVRNLHDAEMKNVSLSILGPSILKLSVIQYTTL
jgi:hypothetical protein